MFKKLAENTYLRVAASILIVISLIAIAAQLMAKDAVADFLERKLPQHVQLKYADIDVNVLSGSIVLQDIQLDFYDRDSMLLNTKVTMDGLELENLGYWDFMVNAKIDVSGLVLQRPEVRHYPGKVLPKGDAEPQGVVQLLKVIAIGQLSVKNGKLDLIRSSADSVLLAIDDVNINVEDVVTGPERIAERIPVNYADYEMLADSLYVNLGEYEELRTSNLRWNRSGAEVSGLQLKSKFDRAELSRRLAVERDHIELVIDKMALDSIRFGFERDTFFIATGEGSIEAPDLEMYRNKLLPDDTGTKNMYSRILRRLPIRLDVPKIEIEGGKVTYSEKVADIDDPGKLHFDNLNASLSNLSNTYAPGGKTAMEAATDFMGYAGMTLNWSSDINDRNDAFLVSGSVSGFDTESINPFLISNVRAKASGTIDQLYFTISGNRNEAQGDIKMKYEDFKFQVLKKNRLGINKLLTAIGNIFVNSGSNTDADGYRYGEVEVERDATKSFFNYVWAGVQDGTISVLTGDGEKEE